MHRGPDTYLPCGLRHHVPYGSPLVPVLAMRNSDERAAMCMQAPPLARHDLSQATFWTTSPSSVWCIHPNNSGSPNSFDKQRVKLPICALLLPDLVVWRKAYYVVGMKHLAFYKRYVSTMQGS